MTIKVGINGFGRIGKLALRAAWDWPDLEFVQINDPGGDPATHAHLLNFDSVHGRWQHEAQADGNAIVAWDKNVTTFGQLPLKMMSAALQAAEAATAAAIGC